MVDHIYGRKDVLDSPRPSFFQNEILLNIQFFNEMLEEKLDSFNKKRIEYIKSFHNNLLSGITYYRSLKLEPDFKRLSAKIQEGLDEAEMKIKGMLQRFLNQVAYPIGD